MRDFSTCRCKKINWFFNWLTITSQSYIWRWGTALSLEDLRSFDGHSRLMTLNSWIFNTAVSCAITSHPSRRDCCCRCWHWCWCQCCGHKLTSKPSAKISRDQTSKFFWILGGTFWGFFFLEFVLIFFFRFFWEIFGDFF